jgi:hypothetical protein
VSTVQPYFTVCGPSLSVADLRLAMKELKRSDKYDPTADPLDQVHMGASASSLDDFGYDELPDPAPDPLDQVWSLGWQVWRPESGYPVMDKGA